MAPTIAEYTALADQIETILEDREAVFQLQDEGIRRRLVEGGRKLSIALEDPGFTVRRICYVPFQLALARVGVEAGIFAALSADPHRTFTNGELVEKTSVDPKLLKRLLRYYQSQDMVSQVDDDGYRSNTVTRTLATTSYDTTIQFFNKVSTPAAMALPDFLRTNNYEDPTGITPRAFNMGHGTDLPPFEWAQENPDIMGLFLPWMNIQREGRPTCFDVLDFRQELAQGCTSSTPLFVDIGGAMGSQSIAFRQRYPDISGRVILQDLPEVVDRVNAEPLPGFENIEVQAHDIFKPQPIKGARAYYLRNVLHDWPDADVVKILVSVKTGMTEKSVIIIDEEVLSQRDAPWRAVQQDMEMLANFSGMERTEVEWKKLIDEAGLVTQEVRKYSQDYEDAIILVTLK
ncbi:putative sterigmatocystin 8-O-methyltransferase precursor [Hypoxylon sp. NC1633]|nr:putative sterigmatocystin 8-O-methyltransferase precursor [Hypoxylon sp. NC1633]